MVLQVIGKHAIMTPKSQALRVYLRGGAVVYRLEIDEGMLLAPGATTLNDLLFKFKLGNVSFALSFSYLDFF